MAAYTVHVETMDLPLRHAFTIARGSRTVAHNLLIKIGHGDFVGFGEFAPSSRYGEDADTVREALKRFHPMHVENPFDLTALQKYLRRQFPDQGAVRAGIEMAYADLMGKRLDVPLHRLWNSPSVRGPVTSFTIGIDAEEMIRQKVVEAAPYPVLKVKLGTPHDRDVIRIIREMSEKEIWVDANEGWADLDEAIALVRFMADHKVTLIEQPMPAAMLQETARLKIKSPLPLLADEGFTGSEPLETVAASYHGINLKLMKTGGMVPALTHIWKARQLGLKVMVGCMVESSLANTAAGIVALWADYCDLDSHLLVSHDPFMGIRVDIDGHVVLNDRPGLGVLVVE